MNTQLDRLVVEHSLINLAKSGEELCGDCVQLAKRNGSTVAVLADGLGSGVKANILATLTARIAATMSKHGFPLEDVVDTLTRTLPECRTRKLAYSTFTIVQIADDGMTYLAEFDNPPVIVLHDGELLPLKRSERNIDGHHVAETRVQLNDGDFVVAVSDGVVNAGLGRITPLGWSWDYLAGFLCRNVDENETAQELALRIERTCRQLYGGHLQDDTTALVMKVRTPVTVMLVVGPPENKRDDAKMAALLQQYSGRRVVCGGTTAQIIAREWSAPIRVDIPIEDISVPPLAHIPGVDLTTEGIITISQTLGYIRNNNLLIGNNSTPARLARLLLGADDIHFVVGRAINPAHQNPALGGGLALKLKVIEELQREMEALGKKVQVTCF